MRSLSIAQRREKQLKRFNEVYIKDEEKARKIFNSYYRYVALYERVLTMDNDSRWYGSRYHQEESKKAERWEKRLAEWLKPYNISVYVPWSIPFLGIKDDKTGAIMETVIDPILYN